MTRTRNALLLYMKYSKCVQLQSHSADYWQSHLTSDDDVTERLVC